MPFAGHPRRFQVAPEAWMAGSSPAMTKLDQAALPQPWGLKTRSVEAGYFASIACGRIGRTEKPPPQLGQRPLSRVSAQSLQNVHSNEQIIASRESGGRFLSQHSQLGLSLSI
jgi:hypothetical protein